MRIQQITVGADPEMFIIDKKHKDKVISSIPIIPGKKNHAWRDASWPEGFGVEIDNILVEYNIPPVTNSVDFINAVNFMKGKIREIVKKVNKNYDIECVASRDVDDDQLQDEEAKLFGCDPDFNAYTESQNEKPDGERGSLRSAGAHIHIGYNHYNTRTSLILVKNLDYLLGVASVLIDPDKKRRTLYGKAGAFRLQNWGVEYRTLSSYMFSSDVLLNIVWQGVMLAITMYNASVRPVVSEEDIITTINNSDYEKALNIMKTIGTMSAPFKEFANMVFSCAYKK